jgi:hypothetical protein
MEWIALRNANISVYYIPCVLRVSEARRAEINIVFPIIACGVASSKA